jgi:hypothetical protein
VAEKKLPEIPNVVADYVTIITIPLSCAVDMSHVGRDGRHFRTAHSSRAPYLHSRPFQPIENSETKMNMVAPMSQDGSCHVCWCKFDDFRKGRGEDKIPEFLRENKSAEADSRKTIIYEYILCTFYLILTSKACHQQIWLATTNLQGLISTVTQTSDVKFSIG